MSTLKAIIIGTGGFARHSIESVRSEPDTEIIGFIEPSEQSREATREKYATEGHECPPYFDDLASLLSGVGKPDVAYIIVPHKFHFEWIEACLRADIDVLVEKPMVMNTGEAEAVLRLRDETGRLVVVGFPGSLSPAVPKAKALIAEGAIGEFLAVDGYAEQSWKQLTAGTWRQVPEISGGGFLFDTGSHLINTTVDVVDSELSELYATLDNRGTPVEIQSSISGRFRNGVQLTLSGVGDSFKGRGSVRLVGSAGILDLNMWGGDLKQWNQETHTWDAVDLGPSFNTWSRFAGVWRGEVENPCPPEVGLRFAKFMDAIKASSASGQKLVLGG